MCFNSWPRLPLVNYWQVSSVWNRRLTKMKGNFFFLRNCSSRNENFRCIISVQVQELFSGNTAVITSERQSSWLLFSIYKRKLSLSFTNYSTQRNVWGVWCAPKVWETGSCSQSHTFTWMKRRWPVKATVLWEPVIRGKGPSRNSTWNTDSKWKSVRPTGLWTSACYEMNRGWAVYCPFGLCWFFCDCCNKLVQTGWLKTTEFYFLTVPEATNEMKVWAGSASLEAWGWGEKSVPGFFQLPIASGFLLACGHSSPVCFCGHTASSSTV